VDGRLEAASAAYAIRVECSCRSQQLAPVRGMCLSKPKILGRGGIACMPYLAASSLQFYFFFINLFLFLKFY